MLLQTSGNRNYVLNNRTSSSMRQVEGRLSSIRNHDQIP